MSNWPIYEVIAGGFNQALKACGMRSQHEWPGAALYLLMIFLILASFLFFLYNLITSGTATESKARDDTHTQNIGQNFAPAFNGDNNTYAPTTNQFGPEAKLIYVSLSSVASSTGGFDNMLEFTIRNAKDDLPVIYLPDTHPENVTGPFRASTGMRMQTGQTFPITSYVMFFSTKEKLYQDNLRLGVCFEDENQCPSIAEDS